MKKTIQKKIEINATPAKVWQVFTEPAITQKMGGRYVSDWKPGSVFGWESNNGQMLTKGIIQDIAPEKLLRHSLLDMGDDRLLSVITYELKDNSVSTTLNAIEELNYEISDEQYNDTSDEWDTALQMLKEIAEQA